MDIGLTYLQPKRIVYVRCTGPYAESAREAWEAMFDWLTRECLHVFPGCGYGLGHDDPRSTRADLCRYDACIGMPAIGEGVLPPSVRPGWLPGGSYAQRSLLGSYESTRDVIRHLRDCWIPGNGLVVDSLRPFMEIYRDDPRQTAASDLRSHVCIPVRPAGETSKL